MMVENMAVPVPASNSTRLASSFALVSQPTDLSTQSSLSPNFHQAIAILKHENPRAVLAWVQLVRSNGGDILSACGPPSYSFQQIQAVVALKGCADTDILAWLRASTGAYDLIARLTGALHKLITCVGPSELLAGVDGSVRPHSDGIDTTCHDQNEISNSVAVLAPCAQVDHPNDNDPPLNLQFALDSSLQNIPNTCSTSSQGITPVSSYCCLFCGPKHAYKRLSDWKKHMRGHEITYICLLGEVQRGNDPDTGCVICGASNPVESHVQMHSVGRCMRSPSHRYSSTRRDLLVDHLLKQHHIYDVQRRQAIADNGKVFSGRQVWSCGFCATIFFNFEKCLKHIGSEYVDGQLRYEDWSPTNIIKGLLSQAGVAAAWDQLLTYRHGPIPPSLVWTNDSIVNLQLMLENGPSASQTPEFLAKEAYNAAAFKFDSPIPGYATSTPTPYGSDTLPVPQSIFSTMSVNTAPSNSGHQALEVTQSTAYGSGDTGLPDGVQPNGSNLSDYRSSLIYVSFPLSLQNLEIDKLTSHRMFQTWLISTKLTISFNRGNGYSFGVYQQQCEYHVVPCSVHVMIG